MKLDLNTIEAAILDQPRPPSARCESCGEHTDLVGEILDDGGQHVCRFCANDYHAHDLLADEVTALCLRWTDACIARDVRLDMVLEAFDRGRIRVEDMIKERYESQVKAIGTLT